jgi:hypothetical protein
MKKMKEAGESRTCQAQHNLLQMMYRISPCRAAVRRLSKEKEKHEPWIVTPEAEKSSKRKPFPA